MGSLLEQSLMAFEQGFEPENFILEAIGTESAGRIDKRSPDDARTHWPAVHGGTAERIVRVDHGLRGRKVEVLEIYL